MNQFVQITTEDVVYLNKKICLESDADHVCYGLGRIESALHSTFYPGSYPFHHGGVAKVAGALAYYVLKAHAFFDGNKRTALLSSVTLMGLNGYYLQYPIPKKGQTELGSVIDKTTANEMVIDELKDWYDQHKVSY